MLRILKNVGALVLLIVFAPVIALILAGLLAGYLIKTPQRWAADQRAMRSLRGRIAFIYSRKRQWGDFIINNVLPLFPEPPFLSICVDKRAEDRSIQETYVLIERVLRRMRTQPQRPFLISYEGERPRRWRITSLHEFLLSHKTKAKRGKETQDAIRETLGTTLVQFRLPG